jgi:large subunit ribosomal protein L22
MGLIRIRRSPLSRGGEAGRKSMEVQAISKFVKMSPSKARDLTRKLTGMRVADALRVTTVGERKAAVEIGKALKSAIANAENNADLSADDLHVKQAVIDEGPRTKRFWPRARGMVRRIERKMCHVKIVLTDGK